MNQDKSKNTSEVATSCSSHCYPTPGPWTIQERDLVHGEHEVLIKPTLKLLDVPTWIADISESKNQAANAKLIAASPDLLEACEMLKQWYDFGGDAPEMLDDCVNAAVSAIRKARGTI